MLLQGPPASGKSDLALRLIDQPGFGIAHTRQSAQLVADDQVAVMRRGMDLVASAPAALTGKLEIRGLGIVDLPILAAVELVLAVRLAPASAIERLPADAHLEILGVTLPLVLVDPVSASAPARIRAALDWLEARSNDIATRK